MESKSLKRIGIHLLNTLLLVYIITGILLLLLAFFLYQFQLDEKKVSIGILVIYILATFLGGFIIGKYMKCKRFIWGMVIGILYVVLLMLISFGVYRSALDSSYMTTLIMCICSGTLGGMFS